MGIWTVLKKTRNLSLERLERLESIAKNIFEGLEDGKMLVFKDVASVQAFGRDIVKKMNKDSAMDREANGYSGLSFLMSYQHNGGEFWKAVATLKSWLTFNPKEHPLYIEVVKKHQEMVVFYLKGEGLVNVLAASILLTSGKHLQARNLALEIQEDWIQSIAIVHPVII